MRTSLFIDSGNVFSTNCATGQVNCSNVDLSKLVYSAGFGLTWITGFGPLTFASRQTFLVDPAGTIVYHYADVDTGNHATQVLADVARLSRAP